MEDQIRRAIADRDFARAQTLADDWLTRAQDVAVAHYFAAWCRDAQGFEADALWNTPFTIQPETHLHFAKLDFSSRDLSWQLDARLPRLSQSRVPVLLG